MSMETMTNVAESPALRRPLGRVLAVELATEELGDEMLRKGLFLTRFFTQRGDPPDDIF
jgi:hypothetical protein